VAVVAQTEAQRRKRPAKILVCLSGRGDKDLETLLSHLPTEGSVPS
jgi:tryptophan synthase beta subunit